MAQSFYGSINFDKLMEAIKSGKVKTFKSNETGIRYINIGVWINDNPNEYGNIGSLSLPLKEEHQSEGNKVVYVADLKRNTPKTQEATAEDFNDEEDDLPFN